MSRGLPRGGDGVGYSRHNILKACCVFREQGGQCAWHRTIEKGGKGEQRKVVTFRAKAFELYTAGNVKAEVLGRKNEMTQSDVGKKDHMWGVTCR